MNSCESPRFNPDWGLYNLDIDKERYTIYIETNRIKAGGSVYVE